MSEENSAKETRPDVKRVPVVRKYPKDLVTRFTNNVVVQHEAEHFVLSFFELIPPPIMGDTEEERREQLDAIKKIEAKCVARLVVTPEKFRDLLVAMAENYRRYERNVSRFDELLAHDEPDDDEGDAEHG